MKTSITCLVLTIALLLPRAAHAVAFSDGCPMAATTMQPGDFFAQQGTTVGQQDDFTTSWYPPAAPSAPDVAFALTLPVDGVLWLEVVSRTKKYRPALLIRQSCATEWYAFVLGASRQVAPLNLAAGTYYVIIDGINATAGKFQISASFDLPTCGDGVVSAGEYCDTGAGSTGDGCTDCMGDAPAPGTDACPGQDVAMTSNPLVLTGQTTNGYAHNYGGSCSVPQPNGYGIGPGGDRVYAVTPAASGMLTATVGLESNGVTSICAADSTDPGCWDYVLYARSLCTGAEITCADANAIGPESVSFPVVAGTTYYLFVDGYDDQFYSRGPFNLKLTLQ